MRILILDDMQLRHDFFDVQLEGADITHVFSHAEAVAALESQPRFDAVYLDHDLGVAETGYNTARYLARELPLEKRPDRVVVHSCNSVGAPQMVALLRDAGIPAYWEMFRS